MDRVRGKLPNTSSRLIAMAASLLGSREAVRAHMQCPAEDFESYCAGTKEPPAHEFTRLVDLIVAEQQKILAKNRELLAEIRRRG